MARPLTLPYRLIVRLPPNARDRIEAVLAEGESMTTFIRAAADAELERRESAIEKRKASKPKRRANAARRA